MIDIIRVCDYFYIIQQEGEGNEMDCQEDASCLFRVLPTAISN